MRHRSIPHPRGRGLLAALVLASMSVLPSCGDRVDAREALELTDVTTGWYDLGIVGGKNKLVPSVAFRLRNTADSSISNVQLNAVFRVVGPEDEELGSALVRGIGSDGLAAGQTSEPFILRSALGYTGEQSRAQMLQHSEFRDAKVQLFAKHGNRQWVRLAEYQISRQLLTQ
jgi:hypothetical protein